MQDISVSSGIQCVKDCGRASHIALLGKGLWVELKQNHCRRHPSLLGPELLHCTEGCEGLRSKDLYQPGWTFAASCSTVNALVH